MLKCTKKIFNLHLNSCNISEKNISDTGKCTLIVIILKTQVLYPFQKLFQQRWDVGDIIVVKRKKYPNYREQNCPGWKLRNELSHQKTNKLHRLKHRCRSAVQYLRLYFHYTDSTIPLLFKMKKDSDFFSNHSFLITKCNTRHLKTKLI